MMTKRQARPKKSVILDIFSAGGWMYATNPDGTSFLTSPEGYSHIIPAVAGESPHVTAWEYYLTFVSFDKLK
jgi:hypothetical protein